MWKTYCNSFSTSTGPVEALTHTRSDFGLIIHGELISAVNIKFRYFPLCWFWSGRYIECNEIGETISTPAHLATATLTMSHLEQHGFQATFETMTAESLEAGDAAQRGWLNWLGDAVDDSSDSHWDLQDLMRLQGLRFEGDGSRVPSWLTCEAGMSELLHPSDPWGFLADAPDGEEAIGGSISIHRPDWITDASWLRVCRLLGWSFRF